MLEIVTQFKIFVHFIFSDPLEINAPLITQPFHFMKDKEAAPAWMTQTMAKIKGRSRYRGSILYNPLYQAY